MLDRLSRRAPALKLALAAPARHAGWCAARSVALWSPPGETRDGEPLRAWAGALPLPGRLVVDVFPRGVLGELDAVLPHLSRPAWLVSRRVRPAAWEATGAHAVIEAWYERLVWCEEPPAGLEHAGVPQQRVAPVLICRPGDCPSPAAARAELGVPPGNRLVILLGTGSEEEQRDLLRLVLKVRARLAASGGPRFELAALSARLPPHREPGLLVADVFPAMRVMRAARVLVAGGGYTAWHEARALGIPAVFVAQPRAWDDQVARVQASAPPTDPESLEASIATALRTPPPAAPATWPDGADEVAAALLGAPPGDSGSRGD